MIKAHKHYTKSDRTSCHRREADPFRLFLHTRAYWLPHQLPQAAPRRDGRLRRRPRPLIHAACADIGPPQRRLPARF